MSQTTPAAAASPAAAPRWLLFVHQIPTRASNARVRTWRRLQQMGAIAVKQAVYVLPHTPETRERFEWLQAELRDAHGAVTLFAADAVDKWSDDALVEEFRKARRAEYEPLATDMTSALKQLERGRSRVRRRIPGTVTVERFRQRLVEIERIDYFGGAGRDEAAALLAQLESRLTAAPTSSSREQGLESRAGFRQRVWVTRPRPGVDRMASAWLIRTFIDPDATFAFAADRGAVPDTAVAFDMFGVRLTHHDGRCTFETLCRTFDVRGAAVEQLAALVHALDLEDGPPPADGPTMQALIDGLQRAHADDEALLAHGMTLFDALHRSYQVRHRSPEPHAPSRTRHPRTTRTRSRR